MSVWNIQEQHTDLCTALMQRDGQCRYGRVWIKFVRTDSRRYEQHVSNQRAPLADQRVNKRWHQRSDVITEDVVLNKFWTPSPVSLCSCNEGAGVPFLRGLSGDHRSLFLLISQDVAANWKPKPGFSWMCIRTDCRLGCCMLRCARFSYSNSLWFLAYREAWR